LKVLHVSYRFGEDIIGGAEKYLWNLSIGLAKLGVDVTIATTTAKDFREPTRWNVFWSDEYPAGEECSSNLKILRFPFKNHPRWLALLYGIPLQKQFDSEEWKIPPPKIYPEKEGILGRGWYFEEQYENFSQRWMGDKAEILIRDQYIWEFNFTAMCPWKNGGEIYFNGEKAGEFQAENQYTYYAFKLENPVNELKIEIRLNKTKRPMRDLRRLGMMVSSLGYKAGERVCSIPLSKHYINELHNDKKSLLEWYEKRAEMRPERFCNLFDKCRGPVSKKLLKYLKNHSHEYDLILGHDFPHKYLAEAIREGKRAGIATAALPLSHLEDEYYHWSHYYEALKSADLTFSLSDYSRDIFHDRYKANAFTLGGGIDTEEFDNPQINGERFRKKYNLVDIPFILFVGRKSFPKRYDALIRSVKIANKKIPCRLVMIGPDENKQNINPEDAFYLGKLERLEMLDAYDACDIFAMLSASESFGMVFTEAWMREKPVIGYKNCGAVASLISDGEDGFLCETDEEVAKKIIQILENPSLGKTLGKAGRKKTLESYTWDIISKKALEQYEKIIKQKKSR
jgi:glycosyltransferase involved in cell wall biosynthesis